MERVSYFVIESVSVAPTVVVLIVGLALVAARRQQLERSAVPALVGCALLLGAATFNLAWVLTIPRLYGSGAIDFDNMLFMGFAVGLLAWATQAAGLALLIVAVLRGAQPAATPGEPSTVRDQIPLSP